MALDANIRGSVSGYGQEVNVLNYAKVVTEVDATTNPGNVGGVRVFCENDQGIATGVPRLSSPEVDNDYRVRVSQDLILDDVVFNYTGQDTGKHIYSTTTMTNAWSAGQLTTNSGSTTANNTGSMVSTYAYFPALGTQTLSADFEVAFSLAPTSNVFIEFGLGLSLFATSVPSDGVFFRLSSAGLQGVACYNGTETTTGVFPLSGGTGTWVYTPNKRYQFIVYASAVSADFWVNDGTGAEKLGAISLPAGQARICMAQSLQMLFKHRIVGGTAGAALQAFLGAYNVRLGGSNLSTSTGYQGNRVFGSYQGMPGGTLGTLAKTGTITSGNDANPTAAVPSTTLASLGTGLGGSFWETASLAVNTDAIIMAYQIPAGTVNLGGKRLVLLGIGLASYIQTVIAGGPFIAEYFLAFGHTNATLASAELGNSKAPRRIMLSMTQVVTAAQLANTVVSQANGYVSFADAPVYVNPGEFISLCTRHLGTAGTSGTIVHRIMPIYSWE